MPGSHDGVWQHIFDTIQVCACSIIANTGMQTPLPSSKPNLLLHLAVYYNCADIDCWYCDALQVPRWYPLSHLHRRHFSTRQ